jgi:hypothetical protein
MEFISRVFYFFTPYTDARERTVGRFFSGLSEHGSQTKTRARLAELLQHNIAVINLWTEYQYKGYRYLNKSQRRKLYVNLQLIAEDFDRFYAENPPSPEMVTSYVRTVAPHATVDPQKATYLHALMEYFSPARGVYEYRKSSSFGRLLRDPSQERLVGDCNQIVTLYIYLYSRRFDVRDLKIRILPEHVALHYGGIDIETTNSTLANYEAKHRTDVLPVEEIVSINLLDMSDAYLSTHEVAAEDILQASRFAFILSHQRELVTHNLEAAYGKLIAYLMKRNNYTRALEFAEASRDPALLGLVGHNGAVYEIARHNYAAARRYAQHAPERDTLIRNSWQAEGIHHYQAHRYHEAIKAFEQNGEQALIRQSYEALFFEEQKKLGAHPSTESVKHHAGVVKRMHMYAKKSGNRKLIEYAGSLNDLL